MLRFIRQFHWYAPYNAMLVHLQRPGSRFVATEPRWRNDFRRVIKPGAQPLVILQPGGPFMVVFDVGDTEALPGARPLPGEVTNPLALTGKVNDDRLRKIWNRTISNAARDGVRVTLSDHGAGPIPRFKPRNEIEAESIVHMVMSRLDPDVQMGDYLLGYAQDSDEMPSDIAPT